MTFLLLFQASLDPPRPELTGICSDIHQACNASALQDLLANWSRVLMRCNRKGLDAKDAGRQQNEVLCQVVALISLLVLLQLFHQVFKYIVAKHLLENGLDPIPVTCVVRHFSAGNAYHPPSIQAYACGPLFSEVDIIRTPTASLALPCSTA